MVGAVFFRAQAKLTRKILFQTNKYLMGITSHKQKSSN